MKKYLFIISELLLFSCYSSESNSLMTFSTKGPDRYEDGSIVLDGEYYALVWQSPNIDNVRFTLDGKTADTNTSAVLRILPRAKDGHCISTTFSVNKEELPKLTDGGMLKMYILDTRIYNNGKAVVGNSNSIQSSSPVTSPQIVSSKSIEGSCQYMFKDSILPEYINRPFISSISVTNNIVVMKVKDTFDNINYIAVDPMNDMVYPNSFPVTGKTSEDIEFTINCNKKTALFRIRRK